MKCPNCNSEVEEMDFCSECGAALHKEKCPHCGKEIGRVKFCPYCGMNMKITQSNPSNSITTAKKPYQTAAPAYSIQQPRTKTKGCLRTIVIALMVMAAFMMFLIVILSVSNFSKGESSSVSSTTAESVLVDATQFAGKDLEGIKEIVGELEDGGEVDLTTLNGESVKGQVYYLPDSMTNFVFVDGKLISYQFCSDNPIPYQTEESILGMFGILSADNIKEEADTGEAIRWSSVSDTISEVWIQTMDKEDKTFSVVKVTYDSVYAGKFSSEPEKPDLELLSYDSFADNYNRYVVGKIKNNTNKIYSYVQVEINLYNGDNLVGSTIDNVNNLEPGEIWEFKAIILEDSCDKFKIMDITGF